MNAVFNKVCKGLLLLALAFVLCQGCRPGVSKSAIEALIDPPSEYQFSRQLDFVKAYGFEDFSAELYIQNNGPGTQQRVLMTVPYLPSRVNSKGQFPAVVVPFYFPEAMLGCELDSREELPYYAGIEMMKHLSERGYVCISADAYHLTFADSTKERDDFTRWQDASAALLTAYPSWTGIGKLVSDTRLLVDVLAHDARVDSNRIYIAGHSLGGKMAFYAGCMDPRVKAIVASDFGLLWGQTNWEKPWYWGDHISEFQQQGLTNLDLYASKGAKPLFLIAGESDDEQSVKALEPFSDAVVLNHASGHRPPFSALQAAYEWLDELSR